MRVPLLDLTRQHALVGGDVLRRVSALFESQQFILGAAVEEFERDFAAAVGSPHAVGMSSGTDAQLAILMALGIGPGDAVVTTPYTFFATAGCIHRLGAEPVFVDVEDDTLNIDPIKLADLFATSRRDDSGTPLTVRGNRIRAVIPVHLFGQCCRMDEILDVAAANGVEVIEDAAQAVGARIHMRAGVRNAGAIAPSAYFSFFPTKNLGGAGDGGMVTCAESSFADRLRTIRNHGMERRYFHRQVGGNFRLDALQAAVIHAKLPYLDAWNEGRRRNAAIYREAFSASGLDNVIRAPAAPPQDLPEAHIFHQFVVRAEHRDRLMEYLQKEGIGCAIYYPVPLHLQECFADLGYKPGDLPVAEAAARDSLALPIFPELCPEEIERVASVIADFYRK